MTLPISDTNKYFLKFYIVSEIALNEISKKSRTVVGHVVVVGGVDVLVDGVIVIVNVGRPSRAAAGVPEACVAAVLGPDRPRGTLLEAGRVGVLVILGDVVPRVIRESPATAVDGGKSENDPTCQKRSNGFCKHQRASKLNNNSTENLQFQGCGVFVFDI